MKRIEFRKLKMYDKLVLIKKAVLDKQDEKHIASMIDECIYSTSEFGILQGNVSPKQRKKMITSKKANEILERLWIEEGLKWVKAKKTLRMVVTFITADY